MSTRRQEGTTFFSLILNDDILGGRKTEWQKLLEGVDVKTGFVDHVCLREKKEIEDWTVERKSLQCSPFHSE